MKVFWLSPDPGFVRTGKKARSTSQRRGRMTKPSMWSLRSIRSNGTLATAARSLNLPRVVAAICPNQFEPGEPI